MVLLSKFTLESLNIAELISICCYYDLNWQIPVIDTSDTRATKYIVNKFHLVKVVYDYLYFNIFNHTIIFASYNNDEPLHHLSIVLFGQFNFKNKNCAKLCKQLNIPLSNTTLRIVHFLWIYTNKPFNYYFLANYYKLNHHRFKYTFITKFQRNRAIFKYNEFVYYLD